MIDFTQRNTQRDHTRMLELIGNLEVQAREVARECISVGATGNTIQNLGIVIGDIERTVKEIGDETIMYSDDND